MIREVQFRNFKALREVSLDLERFTILVGPNASGKTSILEGLYYLALAGSEGRAGSVLERMNSPSVLITSGAGGQMSLSCSGDSGSIHLGCNPEGPCLFVPGLASTEIIDLRDAGGKGQFGVGRSGDLATNKRIVGPAAFLRLDLKSLVAPSYSDDPVPHMESDGKGLPSVLAYLASDRPTEYERILAALQDVVPFVERIRFPRSPVVRTESRVITVEGKAVSFQEEQTYWGNSIEVDMKGAHAIPARMVSEGTLFVLGLLAVVMGPERPRVVLLDDFDRALHPKAQGDLVALLRKLLDQYPEMQIVATSHSPYLLDHLRPEEVRLTTLRDDGSVACGRLDEHPEFEKWKESMTPGEFWSLVGEKWLVEAEGGEQAR